MAREETVLGEVQTAKPLTVAAFLTCHLRTFLSKFPRIVFFFRGNSDPFLCLSFWTMCRKTSNSYSLTHSLSSHIYSLYPSLTFFLPPLLLFPLHSFTLFSPHYSSITSRDIMIQVLEPDTFSVQIAALIPGSDGFGSHCLTL